MTSVLQQLDEASLRRLLGAARSGLLAAPFSSLALAQLVPVPLARGLSQEFHSLGALGLTSPLLAVFLEAMLEQSQRLKQEIPAPELVMTGPELPGSQVRDTGVVVRQLFASALQSIDICGFAVHQGREIFATLAERMLQRPDLSVRMYLNIERPYGDDSPAEGLVARFRQRFRESQWPSSVRMPTVYFDPRAIANEADDKRACLHAKFIVTDKRHVFVTSANFTEAAQERNIEAGVLVADAGLAQEIVVHFAALTDAGLLQQLRWL